MTDIPGRIANAVEGASLQETREIEPDLREAIDLIRNFDIFDSVPNDHGYVGSNLHSRVNAFLTRVNPLPMRRGAGQGSITECPDYRQLLVDLIEAHDSMDDAATELDVDGLARGMERIEAAVKAAKTALGMPIENACPDCGDTGEIDIDVDEDGDGFIKMCHCMTDGIE